MRSSVLLSERYIIACTIMTEMQGQKVTESYFVSCTARAEMSVRVSVSVVGNVNVQVADYNIITPHSYCLAG